MSNNDTESAPKSPLLLLLLDFVGALLIVTGVMELFEPGSLVPEHWRISGYPWLAIAIGALLMVPFIRYAIRKAQAARRADQ